MTQSTLTSGARRRSVFAAGAAGALVAGTIAVHIPNVAAAATLTAAVTEGAEAGKL